MKSELTKQQVAAIQQEVHDALQPILKKHGLAIRKNNARYTTYDVKLSLELAVDSPEAKAEKARLLFGWQFKSYGIDYGTELTDARGKVYTAVGFNRAGKLQARMTSDGKVYHADPRFFRLNGKPLISDMDREIAAANNQSTEAK